MKAQRDVVHQAEAFLCSFAKLADKTNAPRDATREVKVVKGLLEGVNLRSVQPVERRFSANAAKRVRDPSKTALGLGEFYILEPLKRKKSVVVVPVVFAVARQQPGEDSRCAAQVLLFLFTVSGDEVTRVLGLRFEGGEGHHDFPHCQITIHLVSDSPECLLHTAFGESCRTVLCDARGMSELLSVPSIPIGFEIGKEGVGTVSAEEQIAALPRAARVAIYGNAAWD